MCWPSAFGGADHPRNRSQSRDCVSAGRRRCRAGCLDAGGLAMIANEPVTPAKTSLSVSASAVRTVALCFAVAVLEGFDIQAIGVAAPRLAPEFGFAPNQMGWIFSTGNIGLVIGASIGGWLADQVGRKPVLIGSVALFGLFTFATSFT